MDNSVTLAGTLAHDPITARVGGDGDAIACRFTLGIKRTWLDRQTGTNKTYTTYHEIVSYRKLAKNVAESCREGDAVVVIGRLNTRKGSSDDLSSITEVVADHVALNLSSGPIPID